MKDDFDIRRAKLAREAERRISARKGKGPKLKRLYDELILSMLYVFDAYDKSRPFYENGTRAEPGTLVSYAMDIVEPGGALEVWSELIHTPPKKLSACRPTTKQFDAINEVTHALEDLLCKISGEDAVRRHDYLSSMPWWTEHGNDELHWQFWNLLDLTVKVSIREVDIYFAHPEDFEEKLTKSSHPVAFMFDGSIDARRELWESVKTKYNISNAKAPLGLCDIFLDNEPADYPLAFCFCRNSGYIHRFDRYVARALSLEHKLKIDYDNCSIMWTPCLTLAHAVAEVKWDVVDYFRRARAKCKSTSPAHRKWLEAEAEMIAYCGGEANPITPAAANRIITLAHAAAREAWIESRCGNKTGRKDAALDKLLRKMTMNVRLVGVDDLAGKSLRVAMKDRGGRPPKSSGGAKTMTQREVAVAFGDPCNEAMVNNWEARAAGKARGANPPDAVYNGERISYSSELRLNPTVANKNKLTALIVEFQSRHRIRKAIGEKAKSIHCRTEESLYRARTQHGA